MTDVVAELPALEYAPPKPWHRRRLSRRLALVAALIALALVAVRYAPDLWRRAQLAYLQRRCTDYTVASGTVVYTEDPAEAQKLLAGGGPYVSATHTSLKRTLLPTAARTSSDWAKFDPFVVPSLRLWAGAMRERGQPHALLFLQERSAREGDRRLVVVRYQPAYYMGPDGTNIYMNGPAGLRVTVIKPGTYGRPPAAGSEQEINIINRVGLGSPTRKLRFFAGQPDPADPSRFTIDFDVLGQRHTLVGKLDPKWDSVNFEWPKGMVVNP